MRRAYPQIYASEQRLLIDVQTISVQAADFEAALGALTPASHRSAPVVARPLAPHVRPLLAESMARARAALRCAVPERVPSTVLAHTLGQ